MTQIFHPEMIGEWSEYAEFAVSADRTIAYARATNDPIQQHLDGTYAPPVFAIVPGFMIMADRMLTAVPDEMIMKLLHGKQDMHFHRPIVGGETVSTRAKVTGIEPKSSGVVVTVLTETRGEDGAPVNEQYMSGFFRGGEIAGSHGEQAPSHTLPHGLDEPDFVVEQKYDEDQTFRYSEASNDPMPVHLDDDFAQMMGLPGIIIHGLCTMAFTSHALITSVSPQDPTRLSRLAVRFSAPALPRNTITTSAWKTGSGAYGFQTVTEEGTAVIKDGLAEFSA